MGGCYKMKKITIIAAVILCVIIGGIFFIGVKEQNTNVTKEETKVGIVLTNSKDDQSWSQSHYEGIKKTAEELNLRVLCYENVPENEECEKAIDELVERGCKVVIAASYGFGESALKAAEKYPDVYFFHVSGDEQRPNLSTYFGRLYQMRYLSGIVAGMQTETNKIAFVAAFPISEVIRGINAFAIGVHSVNPDAEISVAYANSWSGDAEAELATNYLLRRAPNTDVLAIHTNSLRALEMAESLGIWSVGYSMDNSANFPKSFLTAPVFDWEKFYTPRILECLQGKFEGRNYLDGADTGIVSLSPLSPNVKPGIQEKVDSELKKLQSGGFDVFYGPIKDQSGKVRIAEGESMSDEQMLEDFDWYVEGVTVYEQ